MLDLHPPLHKGRTATGAARSLLFVLALVCATASCQREAAKPAAEPPAPATNTQAATRPPGSGNTPSDGGQSYACETEGHRIHDDLLTASACAVDEDCKVYSPNCPYGCFRLFNRHIVSARSLMVRIQRQQENCRTCVYRCTKPPTARIACLEGTCQYVPDPTIDLPAQAEKPDAQ